MSDFVLSLLSFCESFSKVISGAAKSIIDLRNFAIASSFFGGLLNFLTGSWAQMFQNILEVPVHFWRLQKTKRAMREIERAESPAHAIDIIKKFASTKAFAKDQIIFSKGDISSALYIVESGSVRIVEPNVTLQAGSLFGEMGLMIDDKLRTATTIASEDIVLHEIAYDNFEKLYLKNPEIGFALMRLMSKRFASVATVSHMRQAQ